jgi:hypothetical protein
MSVILKSVVKRECSGFNRKFLGLIVDDIVFIFEPCWTEVTGLRGNGEYAGILILRERMNKRKTELKLLLKGESVCSYNFHNKLRGKR